MRQFLDPAKSHSEDGLGVPPLPEISKATSCFESTKIRSKRFTPKQAKGWEFYNELQDFYQGNFAANPFQDLTVNGHYGKPFESSVFNVNNDRKISAQTAKVVIEEVSPVRK